MFRRQWVSSDPGCGALRTITLQVPRRELFRLAALGVGAAALTACSSGARTARGTTSYAAAAKQITAAKVLAGAWQFEVEQKTIDEGDGETGYGVPPNTILLTAEGNCTFNGDMFSLAYTAHEILYVDGGSPVPGQFTDDAISYTGNWQLRKDGSLLFDIHFADEADVAKQLLLDNVGGTAVSQPVAFPAAFGSTDDGATDAPETPEPNRDDEALKISWDGSMLMIVHQGNALTTTRARRG